jgi:hypothetical protein
MEGIKMFMCKFIIRVTFDFLLNIKLKLQELRDAR